MTFNFGETAKFEALHVPESMKEFKGWYGWECSSDLYIHGEKTKYDSEMVTVMRALYVHRDSRDGKWLLEKLASGETPEWPFKIIGMDDVK